MRLETVKIKNILRTDNPKIMADRSVSFEQLT
jgi:hypothetical protein